VSLVYVNITCDLDSNSKRVMEREETNKKTKLSDVDILKIIRQDASLLMREEIFDCAKEKDMEEELDYFDLDNPNLKVEEETQNIRNSSLKSCDSGVSI